MTFKENILQYLRDTIYFEEDINAIWKIVESHKGLQDMAGRWNDRTEGYPSTMPSIILAWANRITLDWLKKEKPEHFLIPLFEKFVYNKPIPETLEVKND